MLLQSPQTNGSDAQSGTVQLAQLWVRPDYTEPRADLIIEGSLSTNTNNYLHSSFTSSPTAPPPAVDSETQESYLPSLSWQATAARAPDQPKSIRQSHAGAALGAHSDKTLFTLSLSLPQQPNQNHKKQRIQLLPDAQERRYVNTPQPAASSTEQLPPPLYTNVICISKPLLPADHRPT